MPDGHDEWAYRLASVGFNFDGTITAFISYACEEPDHLQISPAIEIMLFMFGRCARCGIDLDGFDNHQKCMDANPYRPFIAVILPESLYPHVDKERRREYVRDKSRKANAARKVAFAATGERHTSTEIATLYEIQSGRCYYCYKALVGDGGARKFTKDHFVSVASGGGNGIRNIVLCCAPCNFSKSDINASIFRRRMLKLATPDDRLALIDLHKRHKKAYNPPKPEGRGYGVRWR